MRRTLVALAAAALLLAPAADARPSFDVLDGFILVYTTGENGSTTELLPGPHAPNRK